MTNKYMNRCSAALVRKGLQIKTTMKYLYIFKERLQLKDNTNVSEDMKQPNLSYCDSENINWENYFAKLFINMY